jgi:hypothetical protein
VPHFLTNTTLGAGVGAAVGMGVGAGVGAAVGMGVGAGVGVAVGMGVGVGGVVGNGVWAYSKDISVDIPLGVFNDTMYVPGLIGSKVNRIWRVSPLAQTLESAG